MTILGIDPGIQTTGYGVIQKKKGSGQLGLQCIAYGCITTPKEKTRGERLWLLEKGLIKLFSEYKPDIMAVESIFFFKNLKTVMPVSEARGVILLVGAKKKIPLYEFTPLQVKLAITGYGRADKKQLQRMSKEILQLSAVPKPDDAADALSIAVTCSFVAKDNQSKHPITQS